MTVRTAVSDLNERGEDGWEGFVWNIYRTLRDAGGGGRSRQRGYLQRDANGGRWKCRVPGASIQHAEQKQAKADKSRRKHRWEDEGGLYLIPHGCRRGK